MSRQATRDTKPELAIRRRLYAAGFRYRVDLPPLEGVRRRADIVFKGKRIAIFIDGCFWHRCPQHGTVPASNREWWETKLSRNVERDSETDLMLVEAGWTVLRIWEHENPDVAVDRILATLERNRSLGGGTRASASGQEEACEET